MLVIASFILFICKYFINFLTPLKVRHYVTSIHNFISELLLCLFCEETLESKVSTLISHQCSNSELTKNKCCICGHVELGSWRLKRHLLKHTREKSYECRWCSYKSAYENDLKKHTRKHTGEKPYQCSHCRYRAKSSSSLTTHLKMHTGEKSFKCIYCSHSSYSKSNLKMHMRTHVGDKPFKCLSCDFCATQKIQLKNHVRNKHGQELQEEDDKGRSIVSLKLEEQDNYIGSLQLNNSLEEYEHLKSLMLPDT